MHKTIIVGGNIKDNKPSSIINKLSVNLKTHKIYNGILPNGIKGYELVLWFPDIPNEEAKDYPKKDSGATLILSKVMREDTTEFDAISRIFKCGANAVVCIYKDKPKTYRFLFLDALGNKWTNTNSIEHLVKTINKFHLWSKSQIRVSYKNVIDPIMQEDFEKEFIELNRIVANKVENSKGARYFGNISTRCMQMFPTSRSKIGGNCYIFSPRNSDKKKLTEKDSIMITPPLYYGNRKYSVDSPCQVEIYQRYLDINYMIHGHAYIKGATFTNHYYPCGDLRELSELFDKMDNGIRIINLVNHGFLLMAKDLDELKTIIHSSTFVNLKEMKVALGYKK